MDAPSHWARKVEEVTELEGEEEGQMLGNALPIGLRLVKGAANLSGPTSRKREGVRKNGTR